MSRARLLVPTIQKQKVSFKAMRSLQRVIVSGLGLCLLLASTACASREPDADQLESLDYFLRWQHTDFEARYAWLNLLLPAAQAELPPEYQDAFSLHVNLQHSSQQLELDYHAQRVIDDKSHLHAHQQLGPADYQLLMQALKQPIACENQVEPGWVGPASVYLSLQYPEREDWLYATGAEGPDGPAKILSEKSTRRYLCNPVLADLLNRWVQDLKKSA